MGLHLYLTLRTFTNATPLTNQSLGCRLLDSQDIKGSEKLAARHKTATLGSGDDGDDGGASKIADLELIHAPNLGLTHWLDSQFSANAHTANHTRAIIVVHKGVIVGERYSSFLESTADSADSAAAASPAGTASTAETHRKPSLPKIDKNTKLLGWSMMKSIHALLIGAAEHQGMLGPLGINRPVALVDFSKAEKGMVEGGFYECPLRFDASLISSNSDSIHFCTHHALTQNRGTVPVKWWKGGNFWGLDPHGGHPKDRRKLCYP